MRSLVLLIALIACQPDTATPRDSAAVIAEPGETESDTADTVDSGPAPDTADSGSTADTAEPDDGLHGSVPDPDIPLPVFTATNRDGTPRGPEHLTGNPTIIWFYRDAGSAG